MASAVVVLVDGGFPLQKPPTPRPAPVPFELSALGI
jgi:hypothetical protein